MNLKSYFNSKRDIMERYKIGNLSNRKDDQIWIFAQITLKMQILPISSAECYNKLRNANISIKSMFWW